MKTASIRKHFIDFFAARKHQHGSSAPVVRKNDPTLLFVNAGMNPFASIFMGDQPAQVPRIVNSQPCIRITGKHNDLEEVGHDTYHHTLFEMMGNWSFGDYFKKEAIAWAWELLTTTYGLPKDRLYATVFGGDATQQLPQDNTSLTLWQRHLPQAQILYASKEDNFWEMGAVGVCGPCTELHIDLRSDAERQAVPGAGMVNQGHPNVIEIWNLVFMQYLRQADGNLQPLPQQHVDTGLGLERLAMVLQGKKATYDTDAFQPLMTWIAERSGHQYGKDVMVDRATRVIADHIRTICFAIADGQLPGTQRGGYVIRRVLRRALRYGYSYLGLKTPFLSHLAPVLIQQLGDIYPRLQAQKSLVLKTINQEETSFLQTLSSGLKRLSILMEQLPTHTKQLRGEAIFELYDTFGFPPDLTRVIAEEKGATIDQTGFETAMKQQQSRSKKATTRTIGSWKQVNEKVKNSLFVGYDTTSSPSNIIKYREVVETGDTYYQIVLDQTPFYPQGGGQVGDTGLLCWEDETIAVFDTKKEYQVIMHHTKKLPRNPSAACTSQVNEERRNAITCNHTTAHLLHAILRQRLGTHVVPRGFFADERGFRLDFDHGETITPATMQKITDGVNDKIRANIPLEEHRNMPIEQAKAMGAMAFFTETYGKHVRVVCFDPNFSVELCGGTHVQATGTIGLFKPKKNFAVAAGIQRIEGLTGQGALAFIKQNEAKLNAVQQLLHHAQDPAKAITKLLQTQQRMQKTFKKIADAQNKEELKRLKGVLQQQREDPLVIERLNLHDVASLRKIAMALHKEYPAAIQVLGTVIEEIPYLLIMVGETRIADYQANTLIATLAPIMGGGGGGKPNFAFAKGKESSRLEETLATARKIVT